MQFYCMKTTFKGTGVFKCASNIMRYMSIEELADFLELSTSYIYKLTCAKAIPFYKIGKVLRFNQNEIIAWLEGKKVAMIA